MSFAWPGFADIDPIAFATFSIAVELLGIAAAMEAIMKTRTSPGAIAWTLSLVLMPTLVLPLYLVFGRRKFRGYRKARRLGSSPMQQMAHVLSSHLQTYLTAPPAPHAVLERVAQMPFTSGTQATLLINGNSAFATLFDAIEKARDYVLLEYYIVRDDALGQALSELLIRKARTGVRIFFLYDEIGSYQLHNNYIRQLIESGVDIRSFHSTKGRRNRFQLNFRNHRKIAVVDGEFGMVGGMNIGDEYVDRHPVLTPWRDTNIALGGPAVQCLQLVFLEDWYWACEHIPALNWVPLPPQGATATMLIIPTGPADSLESCVLSVLHLINSAQRRLWIVSPYFVPDPAVISALQLAAMRGVDVRILLPEKPDRRLVWLSSFAYLDDVQTVGIHVYRYHAGFLHQKVWLIDDECAMVGTTNLDNRSFRLNFEIGTLTFDKAFADQVETMLMADFAQSRLLGPQQLAGRNWWFRLAVRCAHLLAPIQ
ncbi:MAG: cardiolipin synthase [Spongiibacteraceae bacterium]